MMNALRRRIQEELHYELFKLVEIRKKEKVKKLKK